METTPQRRNEPPTAGNISEAGPDMLLADLPLQVLRGSDEITDRCKEKVDVPNQALAITAIYGCAKAATCQADRESHTTLPDHRNV
jgi:hypothetical protein